MNDNNIYTYGDESGIYEKKAKNTVQTSPANPPGPGADAPAENSAVSNSRSSKQNSDSTQIPYMNRQNPGAAGNAYGSQTLHSSPQNPGAAGNACGSQTLHSSPQNPGAAGNAYGSQTLHSSPQNPGSWQNVGSAPPNYNWQNRNQMPCPPQRGPVSDVFCNILLVVLPLRLLPTFFLSGILSRIPYGGRTGRVFPHYSISPVPMVFSIIVWLLTAATILFFVLDIVKIHRQHYPVTGLILFALFLNPGYYLWRAQILGRRKTFPVIYTVFYALLMLASMVKIFLSMFHILSAILYSI